MHSDEERDGAVDAACVSVEPESEGGGEVLLELLLAEQGPHEEPPPRIDGVLVGEVLAVDAPAGVRVTFPGAPEGGLAARAVAPLGPDDVGREVALMFEGGDPARPLVMGRMHAPRIARRPEVRADERRLEFEAEEEIVLRCGQASITLTRAGKILIRGAYVLSRSSGVHRIQGGTVQIN